MEWTEIKLNRLIQFGLLLYVINFSLLIYFHTQASQLFWIFSIISGIAAGIYWSTHHCLIYQVTKDKNRDLFFGFSSAFYKIISVVAPAFAGFVLSQSLIDHSSKFFNYQILFIFTGFFYLITAIFAGNLTTQTLSTFKWKQVIKNYKNKTWKLISLRSTIVGFESSYIGPILVFIIFGNELDLGIFSSVIALLGALISIGIGSRLKRDNRLKFGLIGSIMLAVARTIYINFFSFIGLMITSIIELFALPLFGIGMTSTLFDVIDHSPSHKKHYFEYIFIRETFLTVGRVIEGLIFLLLILNFDQIMVAKGWFWGIGFIPLIYYYITKQIMNKISHPKSKSPS